MDLLDRARDGDGEAFRELVAPYQRELHVHCYRMLGSVQDAEDALQDTLLSAWQGLAGFEGRASLRTWLHRVTVNAALANRRKRAVRQKHQVSDPLEHFLENGRHHAPIRPWSVEPSQQALDRETHELIENAISELPEIYRDVYLLADVEGLPNADTADILGLSVPAVKSRLHRARLLMRNALAPHFEEVPA